MNVAAIKVSHSVRTDIDATTTLRAARARSKSIGAMGESSGNVQSANSYSILRTCKAALRQFSGAMDEMSEKVQHANTHILRHQDHEHAHSSRSVQGSVQGGNG